MRANMHCLLDYKLICLGKSEMVNLLNAGQYVKFYVYFEIWPAMNSLVNLQYHQTIRYFYDALFYPTQEQRIYFHIIVLENKWLNAG